MKKLSSQRVQQLEVRKGHSLYGTCDLLSYKAKNLANTALYHLRQSFILDGEILSFKTIYELVKNSFEYRNLPIKVSQNILKDYTYNNWCNYFKALKTYYEKPWLFKAKPQLPNYKGDKEKERDDGRVVVIFNMQTISKPLLKQGIIKVCQRDFDLCFRFDLHLHDRRIKVKMVRVVPKLNFYIIETVYTIEQDVIKTKKQEKLHRVASVDIGLNNLATCVIQQVQSPIIIKGKPLKSINNYYNSLISDAKSNLSKQNSKKTKPCRKKPIPKFLALRAKKKSALARKKVYTSDYVKNLFRRRFNKIKHYLHNASKLLVEKLVQNGVTTLVIGKNEGWKQTKKHMKNFVQVPFCTFLNMIQYKAEERSIKVIYQEESYTSKASALDADFLPVIKFDKKGKRIKEAVKPAFSGKRIKRGLYRSKNGSLINADVNGAVNILRKSRTVTWNSKMENWVWGLCSSPVTPLAVAK